tara:strand:+ start:1500 stop:1844 length:345 start_codon:yes stop_codon:yes gene_type:complete
MNHNWKIYELRRTLSDGVVNEITFGCESELNSITARKIEDLEISGSAGDPGFIPFDNLTENDVLGWIYSTVDTSSIETLNSASIAQSISASAAITEGYGLPWIVPQEEGESGEE